MNQDEQILNDLDEVLAHPDLSIRLAEGERLRAVERNVITDAEADRIYNLSYSERSAADQRALDHWRVVKATPNKTPSMADFETIAREWLKATLKENKDADPPSLPAIYRLGSLGQSLIFQAFTEGVKQGIKMRETQNPSSAG